MRTGIIVSVVLAALAVGLMVAQATPQGVVGTIQADRTWATVDRPIRVTLADSDLDLPVLQLGEATSYSGAAYRTGTGGQGTEFWYQIRQPPPKDWVDFTAAAWGDNDGLLEPGELFSTRSAFCALFNVDCALGDQALLDAVNRPGGVARRDGLVTVRDVHVAATGRQLAITVIGTTNGGVTFRLDDDLRRDDAFSLTYFGSVQEEAVLSVKSTSDPVGFNLTVTETGMWAGEFFGTGVFVGDFELSRTATNPATTPPQLKAVHGDVVSVEYVDASDGNTRRVFAIRVDLEPPAVSGLAPAHGARIGQRQVTLGVGLTDTASGVASGSLRFFLCPPSRLCQEVRNFEGNVGDGFRNGAYRFTTLSSASATLGQPAAQIPPLPPTPTPTPTIGTIRAEVTVELEAEGDYSWYAQVADAAGNLAESEGDPSAPGQGGQNPFTFTVTPPTPVPGFSGVGLGVLAAAFAALGLWLSLRRRSPARPGPSG